MRDSEVLPGHSAEVLDQGHGGAHDGPEGPDQVDGRLVSQESQGKDPRFLSGLQLGHALQHHPHPVHAQLPRTQQRLHRRSHGDPLEIDEGRHPRQCPHAPPHLSLLYEQGQLPAPNRQVPVCRAHLRFRRVLLSNQHSW